MVVSGRMTPTLVPSEMEEMRGKFALVVVTGYVNPRGR